MALTEQELVDGVLNGEDRVVARLITYIENQDERCRDVVKQLHRHTGQARIVGITGSPGAGKSTLVDLLIRSFRESDQSVGVVAVDPSSPFSGGAILGDRTRMSRSAGDRAVFFRSMSARGTQGGLAAATGDVINVLDAAGKDLILVETVGAGQNEVDIVKTAHTVIVVLTPSSGDEVQMLKAGILEIGDVFVVNKADLEGADRTVMDLKQMLHIGETLAPATGQTQPSGGATPATAEEVWSPQVLTTVASQGESIDELVEAIRDHQDYLDRSGQLREKQIERYGGELRILLDQGLRNRIQVEIEKRGGLYKLGESMVEGEIDPYSLAEEILQSV